MSHAYWHGGHGKRSEKLSEDERQLAFEDLSIALSEVEVQKEHLAAKTGDKTATKPAPKRTIGNLPAAHLSGHIHDTTGAARNNPRAALALGPCTFDSAVGVPLRTGGEGQRIDRRARLHDGDRWLCHGGRP
ncbi:hypothetical protein [Pseudogemmobacter sp. W21_MBD1_M6]|uniref:IS66 family transposase n=1 Tax=Pseudogemmobacter sp. W21_MBD1_M6 TaxID=3240271 RepID=UPI003F9CA3BF